MTDPQFSLTPPRVTTIDFDGDRLDATVIDNDGVAVPVRNMCEALSLDLDEQSRKLRDHPVLSAGLRVINVRSGGRVRSVMALIHTYIPFWLATIAPNQVGEDVRPKLVRYQQELVQILASLFYGAAAAPVASDPAVAALQRRLDDTVRALRVTREALLAAQGQTQQDVTDLTEIVTELRQIVPISAKQAEYLQRAIKRLAGRLHTRRAREQPGCQSEENLYQLLFGQFKIDLGTPRYDALPMNRYGDALDWLARKAHELLPGDADALPPQQERLL